MMKSIKALPIVFLLLQLSITAHVHQTQAVLVGILSQPMSENVRSKSFHLNRVWSFIAGSYVDWVSQTSAIPVLIPYDADEELLDFLIDNVDVMLFPGGGANLRKREDEKESSEFQKAMSFLVKKLKKINDGGVYKPLVTTCLGFEGMLISENDDNPDILDCSLGDIHQTHPIKLIEENYPKSKFWTQFEKETVTKVFSSGVAYFTHHCGFTVQGFYNNQKLKDNFWLLGTSVSPNGKEFVSSVEHKKYPFIGNQWHPEKNQFERGHHNAFLDRSEQTTSFMSEIIWKVVSKVRPTAKNINDIKPELKEFLSIHKSPENVPLLSVERMYCFQRFKNSKSRELEAN